MKKNFAEARKALREGGNLGLKEENIDALERAIYRSIRDELNRS